MKNHDTINRLTAHLFREDSGKMNAILSRMFGLKKIDIIVDIVQDTFEAALHKWRFSGIPDNPSGWLMQVAKNKALNTFKREGKTQSFSSTVYLDKFDENFENKFDILLSQKEIIDSQLQLLFTCCHPNLSFKNQLITTLNILCGFGIPEIANALMMKDEAVKKALTRSKTVLRKINCIKQAPLLTQSDNRTHAVLTIFYLMFNEGYKTTRKQEAINNDLCYEAIRLTKLLESKNCILNGETNALLSLMFFNISRFSARLDRNDEWITLEEQDRNQWNKIFIEEGYYYLNRATQTKTISRFHIEAIISSLHCSAHTFEETNWKKITFLYSQLEVIAPSPIVTFNRIIAESYLMNSSSITQLDELQIKNNFLVFAAKADIYRRKGELKNAIKFYEKARTLSTSTIDKAFFEKKIIVISKTIE